MNQNKYLFVFIALFVSLTSILLIVLSKYYLILLHHTIFYCKEMANTLAVMMPNNTGFAAFLLLTFILLASVIKFFLTLVRIQSLKKNLSKNTLTTLESHVLLVHSEKPFAFCFGILHPKIYLSTALRAMLSPRELRVVLTHEKYHLKHHDTITLLLATTFESLMPYFPLFSDIMKRYRTERELAADDEAGTQHEGNVQLLSVLAKLLRFEEAPGLTMVPAISGGDTVEVRIRKLKHLTYGPNRLRLHNIVVSVFSVTFLLALALAPVHAFELHHKNDDVIMLCNQNQSCERTCKDSGLRMLESKNLLYTPIDKGF